LRETRPGRNLGKDDVRSSGLERSRDAIDRQPWPQAYALLKQADQSRLGPDDHHSFAEAAWWLCRVDEAVSARQKAYSGYVADGANRRAGYVAVLLFYDYVMRGNGTVAAGWLRRAERHLAAEPESIEGGYLAFAQADLAHERGDLEDAWALAERMEHIGGRFDDPDLVALALHRQGHVLISKGEVSEGLKRIDEAMCAVVAGELSPLYTGWLYCLAIGASLEVPDLKRAAVWTEAAVRWCETLPAKTTPYHGLCRIHRVEVMSLRGALLAAEREARKACEELLAYEPKVAAEAFYVIGEIRRRRGDLIAAEDAFSRAHELGREPQPGLALLRYAQGETAASAAALRVSLADGSSRRLQRSRLLAAAVEIALARDDRETARVACAELDSMAKDSAGNDVLQATAAMAGGALRLAENDVAGALGSLRAAWAIWADLGLPYEAAQARLLSGIARRRAGDEESARLELQAARTGFERLGSVGAAKTAAELLVGDGRRPGGLTHREIEVLQLVAAGNTNRAIADELVLSERTVARHMSNIFRKLGVSSRAAATAYAYEQRLV
jgi:ATP/maltotriose-dependent transcriptional regulator MalT